jgi:hypothetical protein
MGVYAEGVAKDHIGEKEVQAHIFEVTTQAVVSESGDVSMGAVPIQILFCLKEKNAKKVHVSFLPAALELNDLTLTLSHFIPFSSTPTGGSSTRLAQCSSRTCVVSPYYLSPHQRPR